jgi:hypothetical protein
MARTHVQAARLLPLDLLSASYSYTSADVAAMLRLVLAGLPVRVQEGPRWSYQPDQGVVTYPARALPGAPRDRVLGALFHEAAEVRFSGPEAARLFPRYMQRAVERGCPPAAAELLLNAINDVRVNRLYSERFPGAAPHLARAYAVPALERAPEASEGAAGALHQRFVEALVRRWAAEVLPDLPLPREEPAVRTVLDRVWPAVTTAAQQRELARCLEAAVEEVLPAYLELVALDVQVAQEQDEFAPMREPSASHREPERPREEPEGRLERDLRGHSEADGASAGSPAPAHGRSPRDRTPAAPPGPLDIPAPSADAPEFTLWLGPTQERPGPALQPAARPPGGAPLPPPRMVWGRPPGGRPSGYLPGGVWRVLRTREQTVDYDNFDYPEAVRRLEPLIRAALEGRRGERGLAQLLTERRFGNLEPWRRPRRMRRGESGEIDLDHPEALLTDPARAFLRGVRTPRQDAQKDYAHAVLLDISGSMVQRGYAGRKFAQLVDTAIVFIEVHQRLKIPFEVLAFSDEPAVLHAFEECRFRGQAVEARHNYVVRDFSALVRRMYQLPHGETQEAAALELAIRHLRRQKGLKTAFIITDGISSDLRALHALLEDVDEGNVTLPPREHLNIVALGVGVAEYEFTRAYIHRGGPRGAAGAPPAFASTRGYVIPETASLPDILSRAVEERIRSGRI